MQLIVVVVVSCHVTRLLRQARGEGGMSDGGRDVLTKGVNVAPGVLWFGEGGLRGYV